MAVWVICLIILAAVLQPAALQDYPLAVVQDSVIDVFFQRSVRLFCVNETAVLEVEQAPGALIPQSNAMCPGQPPCIECLALTLRITQSWSSMGLSCVVWPAATFLAAQLLQIATPNDVLLELGMQCSHGSMRILSQLMPNARCRHRVLQLGCCCINTRYVMACQHGLGHSLQARRWAKGKAHGGNLHRPLYHRDRSRTGAAVPSRQPRRQWQR